MALLLSGWLLSACGKTASQYFGNANTPCDFAIRSLRRSDIFAMRSSMRRWRILRCNGCPRRNGRTSDGWRCPKMKMQRSACRRRREVRVAGVTVILAVSATGGAAIAAPASGVSMFPGKSWHAWQIPISSHEKGAALAQYLESERPNHRLSAASGYSSISSLLPLPAPTFAPTPTAARILASISCAISGFSFRNLRVLSFPWPIFSPL